VKGVSKSSVLAGVIMRGDMVIDGFAFSKATVGGMDATQKIIEMYKILERADINVILLNGCIISWYNVIDLHQLADVVELPLVSVTYKESGGIEKYFEENFPEDWKRRVEIYRRNGTRTALRLCTGHTVYARFLRISEEETLRLLNRFTTYGAIAEPLRIARTLARSLMRSRLLGSDEIA
jgi:endonuclease V-like protein UPF0215 family